MKNRVKLKKCKVCKTEYQSFNSMIKHCSPGCGIELLRTMNSKKIRKELVDYRKKNKSLPSIKKEAQQAFNAYIRARDHYLPCISSGNPASIGSNEFDCGHYKSVGSAPHLRFNLHNAHKQSKHDNCYLSGNIVEYRKNLIDRIGIDKVEALESNYEYRKFDKEYCRRIKKIFNKKTKMRKKRLCI